MIYEFKDLNFQKSNETYSIRTAKIIFPNDLGMLVTEEPNGYYISIIDIDGTVLYNYDLKSLYEPKSEEEVTKLMREIQEI